MAGFFGLFGGKKNQAPQSQEPFFLSEDEAKTFGNIDYMRKEVVVRHTFARKKGQAEELESVKSISALSSKQVGSGTKPASTSFSTSFTPSTPSTSASDKPAPSTASAPVAKRTPDTSMDMFRNMAKKIRR
ncbi:MAG: hypothetical protein F6K31_20860 [Symploca sp. SIO2G7]|nr:hypothetical protein [Symploca sp. SIO2G7]